MTKTFMIMTCVMVMASPAMAAEPVQVRVSTHDLDLTSIEGRKALEERARKAAEENCGIRSASDLKSAAAVEECRAEVVAKVMRAARNTALARR